MTIKDIITFGIDETMIEEAKREQAERAEKIGRGTRNAYEDRDLIGSLAHQGVEQTLDMWGLGYTSTRTERYEHGDWTDLVYDGNSIDVKGTHGTFNEKYYYNQGFLVFQSQLDNPKIEKISHFLFTQIEPDLSQGYIFGIIDRHTFLDKATPVTLKYDNMQIRAYQLKPFRNFIFRV